jgi:hypothetical protein
MDRITIEMLDDGRVLVTAESAGEEPEQMELESAAEAADAVQGLLLDDAGPAAEMAADPEATWNEEAAKRPPQANLMA